MATKLTDPNAPANATKPARAAKRNFASIVSGIRQYVSVKIEVLESVSGVNADAVTLARIDELKTIQEKLAAK